MGEIGACLNADREDPKERDICLGHPGWLIHTSIAFMCLRHLDCLSLIPLPLSAPLSLSDISFSGASSCGWASLGMMVFGQTHFYSDLLPGSRK